jgi:hypothetical protein
MESAMLMKAQGSVLVRQRLIDHNFPRLTIYAHTKGELLAWLEKHADVRFSFDAGVSVYSGTYSKLQGGRSEQYDGQSLRHTGWGRGQLDMNVVSFAVKRLMELSHMQQTNYFVGVIHKSLLHGRSAERSHPNFMHHQESLSYRCSRRAEDANGRDSFTLGYLRHHIIGPEAGSGDTGTVGVQQAMKM